MKTKVIFSKKIALQLIAKGYNLIYTEPNRLKKWLVVFVFEETPELLKELTNLSK